MKALTKKKMKVLWDAIERYDEISHWLIFGVAVSGRTEFIVHHYFRQ
jgi:uncharacterized membrane protein YraQ (UPF0718 family)